MKDVYVNIKKDGDVWAVDGQLEATDSRDLLDLVMILLTTAVRLSLSGYNGKSTKPMERALVAQLKDIVKAEAREVRSETGSKSSNEEDA